MSHIEFSSPVGFDEKPVYVASRPRASIVILDYMKGQQVAENVSRILAQKVDYSFEIIIVDNSCNAENSRYLEKLRRFKQVRVIINKTNYGYTRGCNIGAEFAKGDYILILNPDIGWHAADTLSKMIDYLERNPKVGIIGPRQVEDDTGTVTPTARAFPKLGVQVIRRTGLRHVFGLKQLVDYDEMRHLDLSKPQRVDWLQSSCILMSMALWNQIGGFDERYWLFMADPEICWQAWKRGREVVYYPDATVAADGIRCSSGGIREFFQKWTVRQHVLDSLRFTFRHLGQRNPRPR